MGKYGSYNRDSSFQERAQRNQVHPVWRGLGFVWMIGAPIFSYFISLALIQENSRQGWIGIPAEYFAAGADPLLYVKIGLTVMITLLLYALFSFLGVIFFQVGGHERYGPLDVPPLRRKYRKRS